MTNQNWPRSYSATGGDPRWWRDYRHQPDHETVSQASLQVTIIETGVSSYVISGYTGPSLAGATAKWRLFRWMN